MPKFIVSYKLMTTKHDLHADFKKKTEEEQFCEYVLATDTNGDCQYCQLPNTTLWCEKLSINYVFATLMRIAEDVYKEALAEDKLTFDEIVKIIAQDGLLENCSVSHIARSIQEEVSLLVKEGKFAGRVNINASIDEALEYQARLKM